MNLRNKAFSSEINKLLIKRLFKKRVINSNNCWIWTGSTNPKGYGQIRIGNSRIYSELWSVHVLSAMFWMPDYDWTLWVLHKCDNPPCFNPDHLFQGTNSTNMRDMWDKDRRKRNAQNTKI